MTRILDHTRASNADRSMPDLPTTMTPITTRVPGAGAIELVAYYPEFAWYYPDCEPQTKRWFVDHAERDWITLDCGANVGYFAILFARLAPAGHVYAFEPTDTVAMLERNLAHHCLANVTPLRVAVGNKVGEHEEGIYRIWGNDPERRPYAFTTIDHFVRERALTRVDCIKIDVDSFDFEVLQGAEQTLADLDPYVVVELNHALSRRNQNNMQALEWLAERGYRQTLVLDTDNFVLRKSTPATGGRSIRVFFPDDIGARAPEPGAARSNAASPLATVPVEDLHVRLGYREALSYPADSRTRPLVEWNMARDDGPILRYLYRNARPRRHLEIGTWYGDGVLRVLEESDATVWTINLPHGETKPTGEWAYGTSDPETAVPEGAQTMSAQGADGRPLTWYRTDTIGFVGRKYLDLNLGHRVCQVYCDTRDWETDNYPSAFFDTAFIDGGHQLEVVRADTEKALRLLGPGGLILWHDYCPDPAVLDACPSTRDVFRFINDGRDALMNELADLFWIEPSWLLVGVKKQAGGGSRNAPL